VIPKSVPTEASGPSALAETGAAVDAESRFRIDLAMAVGVLQTASVALFGLIELVMGTFGTAVLMLAFSALMGMAVAGLRRGGDPDRTVAWLFGMLFCVSAMLNIGSGGNAIGVNIGMPIMVLFAVLVSPSRMALLWVALAVAQLLLVAWLRRSGLSFPLQPDPQWSASAIDRIPLMFILAAGAVGWMIRRALGQFRLRLERARAAEQAARAEQAAARDALLQSEQRLRLISDNLPALISYIRADKTFAFNNRTYADWLRRPLSEITGKSVAEVFNPETYALIEPNLDRALSGERVDFDIAAGGERRRHVRASYVPDVDADGRVRGVYGLIHDVTEVRQVEAELRRLSEFDSLTGLANRKRLGDKLAEAIARSERSGETMALLFIDMDRFKAVNDTLGHRGGDLVLQEFARRLKACVRQTDTVARLAGDEFVIVLEMLHADSEATVVAEKIIREMRPAFVVMGRTPQLSASIGIAVRQSGETDGEALLRRADTALYAAKAAGRGSYQVAA